MRLTCPNCDAQYEVDPSLIPVSGRDVQCSNCGSTWFQPPLEPVRTPSAPPPDAEGKSGDGLGEEAQEFFERRTPVEPDTDPDPEAAQDELTSHSEVAPDEDAPEREPEPEPETASEPEPKPDLAEPEPEPEPDEDDDPDPDETPRELPRREIDPKVLGILRAEAEREIAARRADEEAGIETQSDLGLDDPPQRRAATEEAGIRTARLRGSEDEPPPERPRNEILPDIDDINATLTATSDRPHEPTPEERTEAVLKRRSGFRTGFILVLAVVAVLIGLYVFSGELASAVPAAEPALAGYVDWANDMRLRLDTLLGQGVDSVSGAASE